MRLVCGLLEAFFGAADLSVGGSAGEVGSVAAVGEECEGDECFGVGEAVGGAGDAVGFWCSWIR